MHSGHRRARRFFRSTAVAALVAVTAALAAPTAEAAAGVLIDETFSAQTVPANFGFPAGAAVTDGVLNVTRGMGDYTTSVKAFGASVVGERILDLTFDWKTAVAGNGHKTGVELRDGQGNLVFALAGTGTELRYGLTGPVSDSVAAPGLAQPGVDQDRLRPRQVVHGRPAPRLHPATSAVHDRHQGDRGDGHGLRYGERDRQEPREARRLQLLRNRRAVHRQLPPHRAGEARRTDG